MTCLVSICRLLYVPQVNAARTHIRRCNLIGRIVHMLPRDEANGDTTGVIFLAGELDPPGIMADAPNGPAEDHAVPPGVEHCIRVLVTSSLSEMAALCTV